MPKKFRDFFNEDEVLNEDILHSDDNVPNIGDKVTGVYKTENSDTLYILIEGTSPIILVGDFFNSKIPILKFLDAGKVDIDGEVVDWKSLLKNEASEFQYFTGKNTAKGFLNQAPTQRTRAYDSDIYKDTTVRFVTNKEKNVRKEDDNDSKLDVNLSDEILKLQSFEQFVNESNQSRFLHNLSFGDIEKVRSLWFSLFPITDFDEVKKAKIINANVNKIDAFLKKHPKLGDNKENFYVLMDYFTFGTNEDETHELSREDVPTTQEVYNYFQSDSFKSKAGIEKYDL